MIWTHISNIFDMNFYQTQAQNCSETNNKSNEEVEKHLMVLLIRLRKSEFHSHSVTENRINLNFMLTFIRVGFISLHMPVTKLLQLIKWMHVNLDWIVFVWHFNILILYTRLKFPSVLLVIHLNAHFRSAQRFEYYVKKELKGSAKSCTIEIN